LRTPEEQLAGAREEISSRATEMTDEGKPLLCVQGYTTEPDSDVSADAPSWRSKTALSASGTTH